LAQAAEGVAALDARRGAHERALDGDGGFVRRLRCWLRGRRGVLRKRRKSERIQCEGDNGDACDERSASEGRTNGHGGIVSK